MDQQVQDLVEAILHAWEVELTKKRGKKRHMQESLRAGEAALKKIKAKRSKLKRDKDQGLAFLETGDKLVEKFLEGDANRDFDAQKAMKPEIVALMESGAGAGRAGGDGENGGGFGGVYGGVIDYQDEEAVKAAAEVILNPNGSGSSKGGRKGGGAGSSV